MAGFTNVPVTKCLVLVLFGTTVISSLAHLKPLFALSLPYLLKLQLWRLGSCHLIFSNSTQLIFGSLLLFNLRVLEVHYGSVKFASLLIQSCAFGTLTQLCALSLGLGTMATGPLAFIYTLLVPFNSFRYSTHFKCLH